MKILSILACLTIHLLLATVASAQHVSSDRLQNLADAFLREQTASLQDEVRISVSPLDPRLKLSDCANPSAFLTPGSKAWGKITLGIRCTSPKPWTIYLAAQIQVFGDYFATHTAVSQGQILNANDLIQVHGEVSNLAPGVIRHANLAIGKTMQRTYPAGVPMRTDMFKTLPVIQQGQTIKVISTGTGFSVSNEAVAINSANEGQVVKVRTMSGQILSGIAKLDGKLEVQQ